MRRRPKGPFRSEQSRVVASLPDRVPLHAFGRVHSDAAPGEPAGGVPRSSRLAGRDPARHRARDVLLRDDVRASAAHERSARVASDLHTRGGAADGRTFDDRHYVRSRGEPAHRSGDAGHRARSRRRPDTGRPGVESERSRLRLDDAAVAAVRVRRLRSSGNSFGARARRFGSRPTSARSPGSRSAARRSSSARLRCGSSDVSGASSRPSNPSRAGTHRRCRSRL